MQYRKLGRTGLDVSVLSLGSGGLNQFGQMRYVPRKDIFTLVRHALDRGINYFDTASAYSNSESSLGQALRDIPREHYYLSSKVFPLDQNGFISAAEARRQVEQSLRTLGVETLDILCFHKVRPGIYQETLSRLLPAFQDLRAEGKIRHIGITESGSRDPQHIMLKRALQDDFFDVIMVSYHLANRSAELEVLPLAMAKDVGVVGMRSARHQVSRSAAERLKLFSRAFLGSFTSKSGMDRLKARLWVLRTSLRQPRPHRELSLAREGPGDELRLPAAGYTFAVSHPAVATALTGTTDLDHLEQNITAALAPALTPAEIDGLQALLQ